MNRLFLESLKKYTATRFELIIIDNNSNDGSGELFRKAGATVITNNGNYSYPYCQNQGIRAASFDHLAFLNNDMIVSPSWDARALAIMHEHNIQIGSCCATDRTESDKATRLSEAHWRWVKNPLLFLFGTHYHSLKLMLLLRYGNWVAWNEKRFNRFGSQVKHGISGSNVIMHRSVLDKVGTWDERINAADYDLLIRARMRSIEYGDVQPVQLLLGVYLHHYVRLTSKIKYPPFADAGNLIPLNEKWDPAKINPIMQGYGIRVGVRASKA